MEKEILDKLQKTELNMMIELDKYLRSNDIKYSLFYGTAIGAIRHKGFIPWDDDIDIIMTREEFEKFNDVWDKHPINGYFLQNILTDEKCGMSHNKIRKKNTVLIAEGDYIEREHNGIWIDIFVLDKCPDNLLKKIRLMVDAFINIILARGYSGKIYESSINQMLKKIILLIPNRILRNMQKKYNKKIQRYNSLEEKYSYVDLSCIQTMTIKINPKMLNQYNNILFELQEFMLFSNIDELLHLNYGNYMQLPPLEERKCTHNPIKIDFGD